MQLVLWDCDVADLSAYLSGAHPEAMRCGGRPPLGGTQQEIEALTGDLLSDAHSPCVVIYGSGLFHHYTYGLARIAGERGDGSFGYVHLDGHLDLGLSSGEFNFGSFVHRILLDTKAGSAAMIGPSCRANLDHWSSLTGKPVHHVGPPKGVLGERRWRRSLKDTVAILPDDIYLSLDLDVLLPSIVRTHYSGGSLNLEHIAQISSLLDGKNLIGGDICGYSGQNDMRSIRTIDTILGMLFGI